MKMKAIYKLNFGGKERTFEDIKVLDQCICYLADKHHMAEFGTDLEVTYDLTKCAKIFNYTLFRK